MNYVFQKKSPYIDDLNYFLQISQQMGAITKSYFEQLPNATYCNSIGDVYESHGEKKHTVVFEVNDMYGMLVLLGLGVEVALMTFIAERILLVRIKYQSQLIQANSQYNMHYFTYSFREKYAESRKGNGQ